MSRSREEHVRLLGVLQTCVHNESPRVSDTQDHDGGERRDMIFFAGVFLIPMAVGAVAYFLSREITWKELSLQAGVQLVIAIAASLLVYISNMHDKEVWTGVVTKKQHEWTSCEHSYQFNCREQCTGSDNNKSCSTVCDTCYEALQQLQLGGVLLDRRRDQHPSCRSSGHARATAVHPSRHRGASRHRARVHELRQGSARHVVSTTRARRETCRDAPQVPRPRLRLLPHRSARPDGEHRSRRHSLEPRSLQVELGDRRSLPS